MNFVEIDGYQCNKNARSVIIRMHLANPWTWEKQDIKEWATSLFGDQLAEAFEVNDVTGPLLLTEINEEVLRESIIVESWGLRKRILMEINDLLKQYPAETSEGNQAATVTRTSVTVARARALTLDEVQTFLENYVKTELMTKWETSKKPALEQSAYRFWMKQRSNPRFILDAENTCEHILRYRIPRICEALAQSGFTNTSDLRRVSLSLEAACFDARKLMWQMNLLNGPQPPKPKESPMSVIRKKPQPTLNNEERSDESIGSDDGWSSFISDDEPAEDSYESDWNDFIVQDDEEEAVPLNLDEKGTEHSQGDGYYSSPSEAKASADSRSSQTDDGSDEEPVAGAAAGDTSEVTADLTEVLVFDTKKRSRDDNEPDEPMSHSPTSHQASVNESRGKRLRRVRQIIERPQTETSDNDEAMADEVSESYVETPNTTKRTKLDSNDIAEGSDATTEGLIMSEKRKSAVILSSDTHEEDDDEEDEEEDEHPVYASEAYWRNSLYVLQLPYISEVMSQMSDTEIFDLFLNLKTFRETELTKSENGLLQELNVVLDLFIKENSLSSELESENGRSAVIKYIGSVREFLNERADRERRRVQKLKNKLRNRKRARIRKQIVDSDENSEDDEDEVKSDETPVSESTDQQRKLGFGKRGYRKIRDDAAEVSAMHKHHQQMWKEVKERAEAQLQQLDVSEQSVIVNPGDVETAKPVRMLPQLAQMLKSHQLEGIRFLWRQTMMLGTGGVLGHAMGLGKTLQIIAYVHTLFNEIAADNQDLPESVTDGRILILAPVTTLQNWDNEFKKWIPRSERSTIRQVINYSAFKTVSGRARTAVIRKWHSKGGVLLMGYDSFRNAVKNSSDADFENGIKKWLLKPGPSVVIIDEGHKIKSNKSQIYNIVKELQTPYRICMTGYPLQNNLEEYYCMIDFIYPGYLGTLAEFRNAYKNPIEHFYEDSSPAERFISKRQLYKLRRLLADLIHRRDANILYKELKRKIEYDICCKLTPEQYKTYLLCLSDVSNVRNNGNAVHPLQALQVLRNICNHPSAFQMQMRNSKLNDIGSKKKTGTSLQTKIAFQPAPITNSPSISSSGLDSLTWVATNASGTQYVSVPSTGPSTPDTPTGSPTTESAIDRLIDEEETVIPREVVQSFQATLAYLQSLHEINNIEFSSKCKVTLQLVKESIKVGDKLIISSHSIATLNCIEDMLNVESVKCLRIDGSTPIVLRQEIIDRFNNQPKWNVVLVSAKAASLGINLVSANRVILFDLDWNPCHDEQAVARAYRFGQQKEVFVYRLQTFSTIEQHIFRINVHKAGISSRVVDDRTLQPQKQDLSNACYVPPDPAPKEPLAESAYGNLVDPVLRAAAETCKDDLTMIELHTYYTAEYVHEGLNEQQKQEIEDQITLEMRIRNGEIVEPQPIQPQVPETQASQNHGSVTQAAQLQAAQLQAAQLQAAQLQAFHSQVAQSQATRSKKAQAHAERISRHVAQPIIGKVRATENGHLQSRLAQQSQQAPPKAAAQQPAGPPEVIEIDDSSDTEVESTTDKSVTYCTTASSTSATHTLPSITTPARTHQSSDMYISGDYAANQHSNHPYSVDYTSTSHQYPIPAPEPVQPSPYFNNGQRQLSGSNPLRLPHSNDTIHHQYNYNEMRYLSQKILPATSTAMINNSQDTGSPSSETSLVSQSPIEITQQPAHHHAPSSDNNEFRGDSFNPLRLAPNVNGGGEVRSANQKDKSRLLMEEFETLKSEMVAYEQRFWAGMKPPTSSGDGSSSNNVSPFP